MKKLFIILMLLTASVTFAQEQTLKVYNYVTVVYTDQEAETKQMETRLFLNYGGEVGAVKMYMANSVLNMRQVGEGMTGSTESGINYELYVMINISSGEELFLQFFPDLDVVRMLFNNSDITFEFSN